MIMKTIEEYDAVVAECRRIYELKMKDYGPSWRIMRPQTVNDQLFIKAKRVREIEQTGVNMVGESVEGEMMENVLPEPGVPTTHVPRKGFTILTHPFRNFPL